MTTTVYSHGLCYTSVCTDDSDDVMLAIVNTSHPTGIASQWDIADEPFASGDPNPCQCNTDSGKRHVLLVC